jgi:hypothetical protein
MDRRLDPPLRAQLTPVTDRVDRTVLRESSERRPIFVILTAGGPAEGSPRRRKGIVVVGGWASLTLGAARWRGVARRFGPEESAPTPSPLVAAPPRCSANPKNLCRLPRSIGRPKRQDLCVLCSANQKDPTVLRGLLWNSALPLCDLCASALQIRKMLQFCVDHSGMPPSLSATSAPLRLCVQNQAVGQPDAVWLRLRRAKPLRFKHPLITSKWFGCGSAALGLRSANSRNLCRLRRFIGRPKRKNPCDLLSSAFKIKPLVNAMRYGCGSVALCLCVLKISPASFLRS